MSESVSIPGYRVGERIGRGGMSSVYEAIQESLDRSIALKVMATALAADEDFSARFVREGKTVAQLSHPHIVGIHDIGVSGTDHYIAMEYVGGGDLKGRIRESGALDPREALRVVAEVSAALGHAHGKGFIHRDIKPENILFREDGSSVLSDFGIAKALGSGTKMTGTGLSIGTPHYMSPEQARGQTVDARSDLYSLGIVLYECLTGQVPFEAEDSLAIGIKHIQEPLPALPGDLSPYEPLLQRLTAKDPNERYQSAEEVASDIAKVLQGNTLDPVQTKPFTPTTLTQVLPSAPHIQSSSVSPLKWAIAGVIAAALLGGGFYGWTTYQEQLRIEAQQRAQAAAAASQAQQQSQLTRQVQTLLNQLGYAVGEPTGAMSPRTEAGIRAFETEEDLLQTGTVDNVLVQQLTEVRDQSEQQEWKNLVNNLDSTFLPPFTDLRDFVSKYPGRKHSLVAERVLNLSVFFVDEVIPLVEKATGLNREDEAEESAIAAIIDYVETTQGPILAPDELIQDMKRGSASRAINALEDWMEQTLLIELTREFLQFNNEQRILDIADQAEIFFKALIPAFQEAYDWQLAVVEEDFESYRFRYPQGRHIDEIATQRERIADAKAWFAAREGDTESTYQTYLDMKPDGQYRQMAKDRIKSLKQAEVDRILESSGQLIKELESQFELYQNIEIELKRIGFPIDKPDDVLDEISLAALTRLERILERDDLFPPTEETLSVLKRVTVDSDQKYSQSADGEIQRREYETAEKQYERALDFLRTSDYENGERLLRAFLESNSDHTLAGNAQYWLGETFYVRGDFEQAAVEFLSGYQTYPNNTKAPDNLLKLGLSMARLGQIDGACTALYRLTREYPEANKSIRSRAQTESARLTCS